MADFSDTFIGNKIRLCAACCPEQSIDVPMKKHIESLGWMISDGVCMRHVKRMYKLMGFDDDKILGIIQNKMKEAKGDPPRDLSESENKVLVDWLKNPKPYQKRP